MPRTHTNIDAADTSAARKPRLYRHAVNSGECTYCGLVRPNMLALTYHPADKRGSVFCSTLCYAQNYDTDLSAFDIVEVNEFNYRDYG